jgi:hypothetical protein
MECLIVILLLIISVLLFWVGFVLSELAKQPIPPGVERELRSIADETSEALYRVAEAYIEYIDEETRRYQE